MIDKSLKDLCEVLSISEATGRNWLRSGKLVPEQVKNGKPCFSETYIRKLKTEIMSGADKSLKSRRNKRYVSGKALYRSYVSKESSGLKAVQELLFVLSDYSLEPGEELLQLLAAECGLQLALQRLGVKCPGEGCCLQKYMSVRFAKEEGCLESCFAEPIFTEIYQALIEDLLEDSGRAAAFIEKYPRLFQIQYVYQEQEDLLGLLYLSCRNLGARKAAGAYYTPTGIVRRMVNRLVQRNQPHGDSRILDPCCGTGNFLLQLPSSFAVENICGYDIDPISVKLARLNLALKFPGLQVQLLRKNIQNIDYLAVKDARLYDFIIGNPPWGYVFSEEEKRRLCLNYSSAVGKNIESCDVFVERALEGLKKGGVLAFVLPEAIFSVQAHRAVREVIASESSLQYLEYLGNIFDQVQCPSMILQLEHTGKAFSCAGAEIVDGHRSFFVGKERPVSVDYFSFRTDDKEQAVLEKIADARGKVYLKNHAEFALGIVTGNNKVYLSAAKTEKNEPVFRGKDIEPYRCRPATNYIVYEPWRFQQSAPEAYYRAPEKLLYRFISDKPVFAYDDTAALSLNSCNILIPRIEGMDMKYILAVLNSSVIQFFFAKQFHSVKILRSHIERLPIPIVGREVQWEIVALVDGLLADLPEEERVVLRGKLDQRIAALYGLSRAEYQTVRLTV